MEILKVSLQMEGCVCQSRSLCCAQGAPPPSLVPPKRILTLTREQQTSIYTDVFILVSPMESRNLFLVLRFIFIKVQHARLDVLKVLRTVLMKWNGPCLNQVLCTIIAHRQIQWNIRVFASAMKVSFLCIYLLSCICMGSTSCKIIHGVLQPDVSLEGLAALGDCFDLLC